MTTLNLQNYSEAMRLCQKFFGKAVRRKISRKFHVIQKGEKQKILNLLLLLQRSERQLDIFLQTMSSEQLQRLQHDIKGAKEKIVNKTEKEKLGSLLHELENISSS